METNNRTKLKTDYQSIRLYLLGLLNKTESLRLEQACLDNQTLFEEMQEIEDELIDDYASDALVDEDRVRFEQYFLCSPQREQKVRLASAIRQYTEERRTESLSTRTIEMAQQSQLMEESNSVLRSKAPHRTVPIWRMWGAIAAAVTLAIVAGFLLIRNRELRLDLQNANFEVTKLNDLARAEKNRADHAEAQYADTQRELALWVEKRTTESKEAVPFTASLSAEFLHPATMGVENIKKKLLVPPSNTPRIKLTLEFPHTPFRNFKSTLQKTDGSATWVISNHSARKRGRNQRIICPVSPRILSTGDYWLTVMGIGPDGYQESIGSYYLVVRRR